MTEPNPQPTAKTKRACSAELYKANYSQTERERRRVSAKRPTLRRAGDREPLSTDCSRLTDRGEVLQQSGRLNTMPQTFLASPPLSGRQLGA